MNLNILFKVIFWRGLTAILSFLTMFLCMMEMDVNDFAVYSLAFTIYTAFCLFPNMGINNQTVLENKNLKLIEKNNNIKIYFSLIIFFSYTLYYFKILEAIYFFSIVAGISSSIFDYYLVKLQAKKQFIKYSLFMPLRTAIFLVGILITFYCFNSTNVVDIFKNIAFFFSFLYFLFIVKNINYQTFDIKSNLSIYKESYSFLIFDLCAMLMMRAEVWILSFYSQMIDLPKVNIANYWAAFNFIMIVSIMSSTLANIILPYIKESRNDNFSKLNILISKVILIMLILLVLSVFLAYFATIFYFNTNYKQLPYYVLTLGIGVFFSFLANIERLKLIAYECKGVDKIVFNQLVISIVFNFIFIYFLGIWGAIITFISVRLFSYICFTYKFRKLKCEN
jgi:O-antigen/teichoic acid export membrane protein